MMGFLIDVITFLFTVVIILICVVVPITFIWSILTVMDWWSSIEDAEKISFKSFISFYNIAPDKWELEDSYIIRKNMYPRYYSSCGRNQTFYFSFRDYLRYKKWRKRMDKEKEQNESNEIMAILIKEVRKDLEEYNRKGF